MSTWNQCYKLTWLFSFLCLLMLSILSCDNHPKDSKEAAQEMNKPNSDYTKESDERFMVRAAEINLEEVKLGQLAQQKGSIAEVRDLGKAMEEAHSKVNSDLHALASSKGIAIPLEPTQDANDAYNKLNEKSGNDFDKEFCGMMVKGHKDAIDLYDNATKGNNDPDVKAWASRILPDLRIHLAQAQSCDDKLQQLAEKMK